MVHDGLDHASLSRMVAKSVWQKAFAAMPAMDSGVRGLAKPFLVKFPSSNLCSKSVIPATLYHVFLSER